MTMGVCSRCHEKYMTVIAERDAARAALAIETSNANALAHERDALRAEVKQLTALVADMWINADNWSGPEASSHYRSDISFRVRSALEAEFGDAGTKVVPSDAEDEAQGLWLSMSAKRPRWSRRS